MKRLQLNKETLHTMNPEEMQTVAGAYVVVGPTHYPCSNQISVCRCPSWAPPCSIVTSPDFSVGCY